MRRISVIILVFSLYSFVGIDHSNNNECMVALKGLYSKLDFKKSQMSDKIFYLNYTINTTLKQSLGGATNRSKAEVIANKSMTCFKSKEMNVYEDKKKSVSIVSSRKLIFINDYIGDKSKSGYLKYFSFMKDSLFYYSSVSFCGEDKIASGEACNRIQIKVNDNKVKMFNVRTIDFYFNKTDSVFKQINIKYNEQNNFSFLEVIFNKLDYNHHDSSELNDPLTEIFDSNNVLKPFYREYKLIDNRKKNKKS